MKTTTLFLAGFLETVAACSVGTPSSSDAPPAVAAGFDPLDTMSPASSKADALALPLQVVTLSTRDISAIERFYVDGLGMTLAGPVEVEADVVPGVAASVVPDEALAAAIASPQATSI